MRICLGTFPKRIAYLIKQEIKQERNKKRKYAKMTFRGRGARKHLIHRSPYQNQSTVRLEDASHVAIYISE
jgi:hypothetical protein